MEPRMCMCRAAGVGLQQELSDPDVSAPGAEAFGAAVSVSGDTAVVGAYGKNFLQGAAYIFTRSGGVWSLQRS